MTRPHQPAERIQVCRQRHTSDAAAERIQVSRRRETSDAAADSGATNGKLADITTGTAAALTPGTTGVGTFRVPRPRPTAKEVKAKKKAIAREYKRQRRQRDPDSLNKTMMGRRRYEIEDLIRYRFGTLPDTDDRDVFLRLWAWSNPYSRDPALDLRDFGHRLGARLSDAEVAATIRYVEGKRRKFSAKTFGKHLRLSKSEWLVLRPTTFVPFDCTPRELDRLRRDIRVERKRQRRRQDGAKPRAEYLAANTLSRSKPWEAIGMSRRTWYRRRKRPAANVAQVRDMHLTDSAGDTRVPTRTRKAPQVMKDETTSIHTIPSSPGGQTPTVRVRTAEDAFAGAGPALDAAAVYGALPLELRLMALGLSSPGSTVGVGPKKLGSKLVPGFSARRRKAA
jgi:hypothetical protein